MDPASIIGTTSAVLSFITFIIRSVQVGHKIIRDAKTDDGQSEYARCKTLHQALQNGLKRLGEAKLAKERECRGLSEAEKSTLELATLCDKIGAEILALMEKYEYQNPPGHGKKEGKWQKVKDKVGAGKQVIKITLCILWEEGEAKELREMFNTCAIQLNIHLAVVNRSDILDELTKLATSIKSLQDGTSEIKTVLQHNMATLSQKNNDVAQNIDTILQKNDDIADTLTSLDGKVDRLSAEQKGTLDHLAQLQTSLQDLFDITKETLENINRQRILRAISFPTRQARQHQIGHRKLAERTFQWLLQDDATPESSFGQWLEKGQGIYHISGKPGSGKSTLMNFLATHRDTKARLENWRHGPGPESKTAIASVFLYNAGTSDDQRSIDGVHRTILHTILDKYRQDLIPQIFPKYWDPKNWAPWLLTKDLIIEDRDEFEGALEMVLKDSARSQWRYCIFIDGADEFGDQNMAKWEFANKLISWTQAYPESVKICVSSREEEPWMGQRFCKKGNRIRIHNFTGTDMKNLVEHRIGNHPKFLAFDAKEREAFVTRIVQRAEGVFLWTRSVLDIVLEHIEHNQPLKALYRILEDLPVEMEDMIKSILAKVQRIDHAESQAILAIMLNATEWTDPTCFSLYHYSLVGDVLRDGNFGQSPPRAHGKDLDDLTSSKNDQTLSEANTRIKAFHDRLPLLFRGLVDVMPKESKVSNYWFGSNELWLSDLLCDSLVFSHRSVYEYLRKQDTCRKDTSVLVIKCMTAQVNMLWCYYGRSRASKMMISKLMRVIISSMSQAAEEESLCAIFPHLERLDESLLQRQLQGDWTRFIRFARNVEFHQRGSPERHSTVSVFAMCCLLGFDSYVDWVTAHAHTSHWIKREHVQRSILLSLCRQSLYPDSDTVQPLKSIGTLQRLLKAGFNPNTPSQGHDTSIWLAELTGYSAWEWFLINHTSAYRIFYPDPILWKTIGAFLQCGAEPPGLISWSIRCRDSSSVRDELDLCDQCRASSAMLQTPPHDLRLATAGIYIPSRNANCVRDLYTHGRHAVFRQDKTAKLLTVMEHFPDNSATLRDIFRLFGPNDPGIADRLGALYPDSERIDDKPLNGTEDSGLEAEITQPNCELSQKLEDNPSVEETSCMTDSGHEVAQEKEEPSSVIWRSSIFRLALGGLIGGAVAYGILSRRRTWRRGAR